MGQGPISPFQYEIQSHSNSSATVAFSNATNLHDFILSRTSASTQCQRKIDITGVAGTGAGKGYYGFRFDIETCSSNPNYGVAYRKKLNS